MDLFCGCGGLTLGLKQAGFDVVGAVEVDKLFVENYSLNHPEVRVWTEDITKLDPEKIMTELNLQSGDLDLLAGCPPCQGFSGIGTKDVLDERNDLVFEYVRFVKVFEPKTVMMENVPGLLKDDRINKVLEELKKIGYCFGSYPKILNAADYGVPQRRKRMILMGMKGRAIKDVSDASKKATVRDAIGTLPVPGRSGDLLHDFPENRTKKVKKLIRKVPKDGGSFRNLDSVLQLPCHQRCSNGFKDIYGRMKWDDVSPTITGGCTNPSKGRFLHPEQHRAITLREAALLQSFPVDYQFKGGKGKISLMIGNALPPVFIKKHASLLRDNLRSTYEERAKKKL